MANYNSFTTSNGFNVMNIDDFKKELQNVNGLDHFEFLNDGLVYVATYEGLYSTYYENNNEDEFEFEHEDYLKLIQKHMRDDQKVIVSSVGHEKLRYLTADCSIITKDKLCAIDS